MATSRNSRTKNVIIIVIVAGFAVSSIAGTFLLALQSGGDSKSAAEIAQERMMKELQEEQEKQLKEQRAQNRPLKGYEAKPFDADSVTELKVETLKQGNGPAATAESTVEANYFGWMSDGTIFDSTHTVSTNESREFPLDGVIEGWTKGLTGVKQGSVVKLMIPGDMAYGNEDTGMGQPFGPLAFIVELVKVK